MFFNSTFGPMSNDSKQGLVSVAITLRPAAAEVGMLTFILNFCKNTTKIKMMFVFLFEKWAKFGQLNNKY